MLNQAHPSSQVLTASLHQNIRTQVPALDILNYDPRDALQGPRQFCEQQSRLSPSLQHPGLLVKGCHAEQVCGPGGLLSEELVTGRKVVPVGRAGLLWWG